MVVMGTGFIHSAGLVREFEAALHKEPMGLSEAVAAIRTLLQFIRNCQGLPQSQNVCFLR